MMIKNKKGKSKFFVKNKKGDERLLSIYLFMIYIIVSIGMVSGVILFHGAGLDVREVEAGILSNRVIDCLTEQGELKKEVLKEDFDLAEFCKIDLMDRTDAYKGEEQSGVRVELFDFDSCANIEDKVDCSVNLSSKIEIGRSDFFGFCELEGKKIPKCSEKSVYILDNNKGVMLKVLSAVRKLEKNV